MERLSSLFNEKVLRSQVASNQDSYRRALFYLMSAETSCYRYWGQGIWTDYGKEISRRGLDVLNQL